jgi:hypothetical protein
MNKQIIDILKTDNSTKDHPRVVEELRGFTEEDLFQTLFYTCIRRQGEGLPVAPSAYAINELNPKCLIPLKEAIEKMLPEWDISIEEVVFYLAKQFGKQQVRSMLQEFDQGISEDSRIRIETIDYWLGVVEE